MSILTRSTETLRSMARGLLAQDCLLCGASSSEDLFCPPCAASLPLLEGGRCPQCAMPNPTAERCGRCLTHRPHFDSATAPYRYAFPLDKLVQSYKYAHRLAIGNWFGEQMARRALSDALLTDIDFILPLPLHPRRLIERGFNQALELARPIAAALGKPLAPALCRRVRHTPIQAALPWKERAANIRGAFHCPGDLSQRHILLVDDVMTSGASLDECARTLKLHGAATVRVLVLARALPKGVGD